RRPGRGSGDRRGTWVLLPGPRHVGCNRTGVGGAVGGAQTCLPFTRRAGGTLRDRPRGQAVRTTDMRRQWSACRRSGAHFSGLVPRTRLLGAPVFGDASRGYSPARWRPWTGRAWPPRPRQRRTYRPHLFAGGVELADGPLGRGGRYLRARKTHDGGDRGHRLAQKQTAAC